MKKILSLFTFMGLIYILIEAIYRAFTDFSSISITQSSIAFIMGGLSGVFVGLLNESKHTKNMKMYKQAILGTIIILTVEYFAGITFNSNYSIWDYRELIFNVNGQICLPFGFAWFLLTPFNVWLDDHLRYNYFDEEANTTMINYYKKLFTGR